MQKERAMTDVYLNNTAALISRHVAAFTINNYKPTRYDPELEYQGTMASRHQHDAEAC
jgi:hypothetical protein